MRDILQFLLIFFLFYGGIWCMVKASVPAERRNPVADCIIWSGLFAVMFLIAYTRYIVDCTDPYAEYEHGSTNHCIRGNEPHLGSFQ